MSQYRECTQGPCWNEYIYVGPRPRARGSCIKKSKICKKKSHKCKNQIDCNRKVKKTHDLQEYRNCLEKSQKEYDRGTRKLCPRGYCTAKQIFDVYPSAYANGYAASVCKGSKPDLLKNTVEDISYTSGYVGSRDTNSLNRWYNEQWVNVCERGDGPGGYAVCGSGRGLDDLKNYPYCRAYYKFPGTTVVTAPELTRKEISEMCKKKRSLRQGIDGKPTRIRLSRETRNRVKKNKRKDSIQKGGKQIKIPKKVKKQADLGLKLLDKGYNGGTQTGWNRARQLSNNEYIDLDSLADMRTWFSRHGPDAKNGGTSYPGYLRWLEDKKPMNGKGKNKYRGAVAWLIWGGDAAYTWLKTKKIRKLLESNFPNRKKSPFKNNLLN